MFLACEADIALFGGSAHSGKSAALLLDVLRYIHTPGWKGMILRRHANDHADASSIYEKAKRFFAGTGHLPFRAGQYMDVRWPSGAVLMFRHVDDAKLESYQGGEYAWIGVDEVTHFDMLWLRYLITRMRTHSGAKVRMRMTCNPDPDHAIAEWVDPYYLTDDAFGTADRSKSGRIRYWATDDKGTMVWGDTREECSSKSGRPPEHVKTFAFIAGTLEDNVIGSVENPDYEANLATSGPVNEARLRFGGWRVRAEIKGMLRSFDAGARVRQPISPIVHRVRAWDIAATRPSPKDWNPDYTIGIRIEWDYHGRWYITDLVACRENPSEVNELIARTVADDGPDVNQVFEIDPGGAGKFVEQGTKAMLRAAGNTGVIEASHVRLGKVVKATPMADQLRLGMDGNKPRTVALKEGEPGEWQPRGFILLNGWRERSYRDAAEDHPTTLGALFDRQWANAFGDEHDDIPDAASIAINSRKPPPPKPPDPLERLRRMS